ncbi:MAG TPA: protein kinase [Thermoanaerobaculia bacterium]|nr:protein kinase [Thermoanaerobaculia bacterium]
MSATPPLGPYRIGERAGSSVWIAEDTRSGKQVAVKLLTKQLPKETAKREAMIRDVRVSAALYHVFLVPIIEIAPIGENLVMIMDVVDGESVAKKFHNKAVDRAEFFRIAYQLVDAVKFLHLRNLRHGNINADSVLVTADGQVKLGGLNLGNLLPRENNAVVYQQKGNDPRSVAYMAPEIITARESDERADIFSIGALLYELGVGKPPFSGTNATDIARAIVEGNPASPKAINPSIDPTVLQVLGGCLYKDPFKRVKDAKLLLEAIVRLDPECEKFAQELVRRATEPGDAPRGDAPHQAILLIADLANYTELEAESPEKAKKTAARMQQLLGESVYLFDGQVGDPFDTRLIAEMPSIDKALEAARKGEFDFSPEMSSEPEPLQVRMLLTGGEVTAKDGAITGTPITRGFEVLAQLPPLKLHITEDFVKLGRGNVRLRDAGARAGVKLYTIVDSEPKAVVDLGPEPTTADIEQELKEEAAAIKAEKKQKTKRGLGIAAAAIIALVVIGGGLGVMWMRRGKPEKVVTAAPVQLGPATAARPRKVLVDPIAVEGTDPTLAAQANAVRLGAIEILRSFPEIRIADTPGSGVTRFAAKVRAGAAGPEIVAPNGIAVPMIDTASGIHSVVEWVTADVSAPAHPPIAAAAMNAFADALLANASNDTTRADASLRAALTADPNFLAAQMLAMHFFESNGNVTDSLAAAKQIVVLDPANLDAARVVARANLGAGDLQQAFAMYDRILKRQANDAESLNLVARYALGSGDTEKFGAVLRRLNAVPARSVAAHPPDVLVVSGRFEAAISPYYDIEVNVPNNPALALKIGRISVLRHSLPIADLELKKLSESDPVWAFHLLKAYIAAQNGTKAEAETELQIALAAATPGDESWTSAAEVYALLADSPRVITALEKAAQRKEPTAAYVLANPLFRYLQSEARFQTLRDTLTAQQNEMRVAVAQIAL